MRTVAGRAPVVERVLSPLRQFIHTEVAGGVVLLAATIIGLVWANSPWRGTYDDLWHATVTIQAGDYGISMSLAHWINDGLMAIFFFVVGLEIKREVLAGELSSLRKAALPIGAAAGGAILPALIYLGVVYGGEGRHGWGVPMATDIAFALGVLALLGSRVPTGLKVFLTALAIVDDILAVLVIALFYSDGIAWGWLFAGAGILILLVMINQLDVSRPLAYALPGLVLWVCFLESGVHATVAGVLLALTVPARTRIDLSDFVTRSREVLDNLHATCRDGQRVLTSPEQQSYLQDIETAAEHAQPPMLRLERLLHPWVAWFIVPFFALANAGVEIGANAGAALESRITLGVVVGLLLGKQVGIFLASWLLVRGGLATLPEGTSWRAIHGAGVLGGIGFTMSLFIAELAFESEELLALAKLGILAASVIAGATGYLLLRFASSPEPEPSAATSPAQAS